MRKHLAAARRWWRQASEAAGIAPMLSQPGSRRFVVQFVLLLLVAALAAEAAIALVSVLWDGIVALSGVGELEPFLRAALLVFGLALALIVLWTLIGAVQATVVERMGTTGATPPDPADIQTTILLVIGLLLAESFTSAILVEFAGLTPLAGTTRLLALGVAILMLVAALILLAATTLYKAERLVRVRFVNRIEEVDRRPASWPARAVICALSTPSKLLIEDSSTSAASLTDYRKYAGNSPDDHFNLFIDPGTVAKRVNKNESRAKRFVDQFNWRQIALAYQEQIESLEIAPGNLPLLILLCSKESHYYVDEFQEFFEWLLATFVKRHPDFDPNTRLRIHPARVDFEDFERIAKALQREYTAQCERHGAGKVVIDITGGQRPWALAALEVTVGTEESIFSYVTQESFLRDGRRSWVRYYNFYAVKEGVVDPASHQLGTG